MAPPPGSIPPPLAPSIEEAYKRKCQQLKRRMNEVEENNEAAFIRVSRLRREIEKVRLERVFLLDQLTRRTSTNLEDSEGSPSPPSTPQEKPLRIKRGHRKPDLDTNLNTSVAEAGPSNPSNASPTSDTVSQAAESFSTAQAPSRSQPEHAETKLQRKEPPKSGYELFYNERLDSLLKQNINTVHQGHFDQHTMDLIQGEEWKALSEDSRRVFRDKYENYLKTNSATDKNGHTDTPSRASDVKAENAADEREDDDVEMVDGNGGE